MTIAGMTGLDEICREVVAVEKSAFVNETGHLGLDSMRPSDTRNYMTETGQVTPLPESKNINSI